MSNFNCEKCGLPILEDDNGVYITECEHYPLEELKKHDRSKIIDELLGTFVKFSRLPVKKKEDT